MLRQGSCRFIQERCRQVMQLVARPHHGPGAAQTACPSAAVASAGVATALVTGLRQHSAISSTAPASSSSAVSNNTTSSSSSSYSDAEEVFPEMQLQLPPPTHALVKSADFVKSSVEVKECPPLKHPEFAIIGRSNVGKSSLINMLTNRKSLAMVSKQPGKTRCINHFIINNSWYLVDLPGYGYARTGKVARQEFDQFTRAYFKQRPTLVMVLLLVDSSIPPQDIDLEYAAWLGQQGLPFSIVFTKADKRKKGMPKHRDNMAAFKRALLQQHGFSLVPPCLVTGSAAGIGKQEVLNYVASLRVMFEQQKKQLRPKQTSKESKQQEEQDEGST